MWARDRSRVMWWAGRESNPHSRRRLIYSQRSSPPAQPTHVRRDDGPRLRSRGGPGTDGRRWSRRRDSNPEPAVYKTAALPIELRRHDGQGHTADDLFRRRGMIRSVGRERQPSPAVRRTPPCAVTTRTSRGPASWSAASASRVAPGRSPVDRPAGGRPRLTDREGPSVVWASPSSWAHVAFGAV